MTLSLKSFKKSRAQGADGFLNEMKKYRVQLIKIYMLSDLILYLNLRFITLAGEKISSNQFLEEGALIVPQIINEYQAI